MSKEFVKPTDDGVEILYRRYVKDDPEALSELEKIEVDDELERKIFYIQIRAFSLQYSKIATWCDNL